MLQPDDPRASQCAGAAVVLPHRLLSRRSSLLNEVASNAPRRLCGPGQVDFSEVAGYVSAEAESRDNLATYFAEVLDYNHRRHASRPEVMRGTHRPAGPGREEGRTRLEVGLRVGLRHSSTHRDTRSCQASAFLHPVHHHQGISLCARHRRHFQLLFIPALPVLPSVGTSGLQEGRAACVALLDVRFDGCFGGEDQAAVETAEVAGVLTPRSSHLGIPCNNSQG